MGLFSKLVDKNKLERTARGFLSEIKNEIDSAGRPSGTDNPSSETAGIRNVPPPESSGFEAESKWDVMPAEENQYNFDGTYIQYFKSIFDSEFSQYSIDCSTDKRSGSTVFTFFSGSEKQLVVEILSEQSRAKKLRSDCAAEGVAYLRFYHNHHGWWNTRSYVVSRVSGALGL